MASFRGELVVKAKVIEHSFQTSNGKKFGTVEEAKREQKEHDLDSHNGFGESIRIQILDIIKGSEERKVIEIFGSDGADCRQSLWLFKVDSSYIFRLYKPSEDVGNWTKLPGQTDNDYAMGGCAENWLSYIPIHDAVRGKIFGLFAWNDTVLNYSAFKEKTKIHSAFDSIIQTKIRQDSSLSLEGSDWIIYAKKTLEFPFFARVEFEKINGKKEAKKVQVIRLIEPKDGPWVDELEFGVELKGYIEVI